jgi:hypothetical protein
MGWANGRQQRPPLLAPRSCLAPCVDGEASVASFATSASNLSYISLFQRLDANVLAQASGIKVSDACVDKYQELKLGKNIRAVIFTINNENTEIVVEKDLPKNTTYDEFVNALPADDCRYAVYDFEYTQDGGLRNKLLFVVWYRSGSSSPLFPFVAPLAYDTRSCLFFFLTF